MANLFLYFVCVFAFLSLGGASDDLSSDSQDSTVAYLDISSTDSSGGDHDDLDTALFSLSVFSFISQETKLNPLYYFLPDPFTIQSFNIRAPPYSS